MSPHDQSRETELKSVLDNIKKQPFSLSASGGGSKHCFYNCRSQIRKEEKEK